MARYEVASEVAGSVWGIMVAPGEAVEAGATLIVLESMKMELPVETPVSGTVAALRVDAEEQVEEGQVVAVLDT